MINKLMTKEMQVFREDYFKFADNITELKNLKLIEKLKKTGFIIHVCKNCKGTFVIKKNEKDVNKHLKCQGCFKPAFLA